MPFILFKNRWRHEQVLVPARVQVLVPVPLTNTQGTHSALTVENWGLTPYTEATERQLRYLDEVAEGQRPETLIFCTHPPVVTLGRGTQPQDVFGWSGETVETSRGGRATYHGPSQLVIYPILNLNLNRSAFAARDLHGYLRALESATVAGLKRLGLAGAEARTIHREGEPSLTGVWVGNKKIASIGIAVKKWVTYHGVAINLFEDAQAFSGIQPCGFQSSVMTSVEKEIEISSKGAGVKSAARDIADLNQLKIENIKNIFESEFIKLGRR